MKTKKNKKAKICSINHVYGIVEFIEW